MRGERLITATLVTDYPDLNWVLIDFENLPRVGEDITVSLEEDIIHLRVVSVTYPVRIDADGSTSYFPQLKAKVI